MLYPIMNERDLAERWNISVKTLRRWRFEKIGPVYRKLFQLVRYAESDVLAFERQCSHHWAALATQTKTDSRLIKAVAADSSADTVPGDTSSEQLPPNSHCLTAKQAASITRIPRYYFTHQSRRDCLDVPHLTLVRLVRFCIDEIYHWEVSNSTLGFQPPQVQSAPTNPATGLPGGASLADTVASLVVVKPEGNSKGSLIEVPQAPRLRVEDVVAGLRPNLRN